MGIKERRTKILAALYFITDLSFAPVELTENVQTIFDISLNPKTKSTLQQIINEGLIIHSTEEDSKKQSYQLTDKGFEELSLEFPFIRFLKTSWDGKWRILSYEIPEKKREIRDRLRREVAGWGLGPWHRSFWITPHPIIPSLKALVSNKEEESYVQAFESDHVFGDRGILIEKVWNTSELEKKYRQLFKTWHDTLSTQISATEKIQKIISEYISILRVDPGLPPQLLGSNWIGYEGFKIYKEIRGILLKEQSKTTNVDNTPVATTESASTPEQKVTQTNAPAVSEPVAEVQTATTATTTQTQTTQEQAPVAIPTTPTIETSVPSVPVPSAPPTPVQQEQVTSTTPQEVNNKTNVEETPLD